jgi:hypothetical protein
MSDREQSPSNKEDDNFDDSKEAMEARTKELEAETARLRELQ